MPSKSILLVEDDFDIGEALSDLLTDLGHRVKVATNGKVALDQLHHNGHVDVIVLDLMMPVMDGYEFRARQLSEPAIAGIPVVVVSADTKAESRRGELQPKALFCKPVPIDQLTALIDSL